MSLLKNKPICIGDTLARDHITTNLGIPHADEEAALVAFLKEHRRAFLRYVDEHTSPMYNFEYEHLNDVLERVFRNRRLPGRPVTGLFETQKHVVGAAYAALQHRKGVIVVGEMGVGKSAIGAATVAALHSKGETRPGQVAVVMCPPHLVDKWVRELHDVIPDCAAQVVKTVEDVVAFMSRAETLPKMLHVMVLSRERAKLGEGWEPALMLGRVHIAQWGRGQEPPKNLAERGRIVTRKRLCCPTCGDEIATHKDGKGRASMAWLKQQPRACVHCGSPLWQLKRRWSGPKAGEKFPRRNPRYPLATFLRQRYPKRVGAVVIDELHETKGGGTDQGRAMQELVLIANKAIGLTGTLFGGVASSVFWLEWAFNPRMVELYPISSGRGPALNRWTQAMGVLEKVVEYKEEKARSGAFTTTKRIEHQPREAPGISPRLVAELIDHCLWVGLSDLNFALPDYEEFPVPVTLPHDVQQHYDQARDEMISYHMACVEEGDASFLSTYFQAVLRYPSSCFRQKPVIHKLKPSEVADGEPVQKHVTVMEGFGETTNYPKEEALLDVLNRELEEGRRCVVFVSQTGTLDIQPRLAQLIEEGVLDARAVVLRQSTTATDKRDVYLERKVASGHNVLITNPRLVQTGLDLIAFPTLIFYEVDNSLYVTSQASRRAWRIGQTRPCRVYYMFYENTMEARAIDLISRKQAAAALLGGDADGGGLAQIAGSSNSLMAELAKTIAQDEAVVDVKALFQQKAKQSVDFTSGWAANMAETKDSQPELTRTVEAPVAKRSVSQDEKTLTIASDVSGVHQQYQSVKRQFPDAVVMIRLGDSMKAFGKDAQTLARELGLALTTRMVGRDKHVAVVSFRAETADNCVSRLMDKGYDVALFEMIGSQSGPENGIFHTPSLLQSQMGGRDAVRSRNAISVPLIPMRTPARQPLPVPAGEQLPLF